MDLHNSASLQVQTRAAVLEPVDYFDEYQLASALHRLADAGWNSVILPAFIEGYPVFPSETWARYKLRRQHPKLRKWNPFEVAIEIGMKRNIKLFISHSPFRAYPKANKRKPPMLRHYPNWAAKLHPKKNKRSNITLPSWNYYCPINPDLRRFLADTLHEIFESYPLQGLLIDLRHYPFFSSGDTNPLWCYCKICRKATLDDLGFDPADVDFTTEKDMVQRWREWQSQQLDKAMAYMRLRVLKARRSLRFVGLLTTDIGHDQSRMRPLIHWKSWVDRSLIESLVLDGYSPELSEFSEQFQSDCQSLSNHSLLLPMLPRKVEDGAQFLDLFSSQPIAGFCSRFEDWTDENFNPESRVLFQDIAHPAIGDPIRSLCILFNNIEEIIPEQEELKSFLRDLQGILLHKDKILTVDRLLMVAANVKGLLSKINEGTIILSSNKEQVCLYLDLANRLIYLAGSDLRD